MDEYEKLEMELQDHYNVYLERFCNLHYLQRELEMCEKEESCKLRDASRTLKRMQKKIWDEELRILHGEEDDSEVSIGENVYEQQQDGHKTPILSHADASSVYESGQDTDEERGSGAGNFFIKGISPSCSYLEQLKESQSVS